MTDFQSGIADKFDIEDIDTITVKEEQCTFHDDQFDDIEEDYKFIRKKLRYCVAASETVFSQSLRQVTTDPSPRCIEGCSQIIKVIIEATKELQAIHEKQRKFKKEQPKQEPKTEDGKNTVKSTLNDIMSEINNQSGE